MPGPGINTERRPPEVNARLLENNENGPKNKTWDMDDSVVITTRYSDSVDETTETEVVGVGPFLDLKNEQFNRFGTTAQARAAYLRGTSEKGKDSSEIDKQAQNIDAK